MSTKTERPHIVREGDTPLRLSVMYDVPIATIAGHAKNQDLGLYFQRNMLPVGKVVTVPIQPKLLNVSPGVTNRFQATAPMHEVSIVFNDEKGPLAGEPYVLYGLADDPIEGALDGAGHFAVAVPLTIDQIRITFPKRYVEHTLLVGHLLPPDQDLGCEARLLQLGYGPVGQMEGDPFTFNDRDARAAAISSMQVAFGLSPTGLADPPTLNEITTKHGEGTWT